MNTRLYFLLSLLPIAILSGCAAPVTEQEQTQFLSDYSRLAEVEDSHIYASPNLANYSSFIVEPVKILFEQDPQDPEFTDEDFNELNEYVLKSFTKIMTEDGAYQVVTEPGPGVARFLLGITDLDATDGALNVTIYTKATGAGLGGIAIESEIVDSVTGEQLGASIRWGSGSRVLRAGFTRLGDAKILIDRWIKDGRERLDSLHGQTR